MRSALLLVISVAFVSVIGSATVPHVRPAPSTRRMNSTFINQFIDSMVSRMADPDLATLFSNCFPNTLDTTVRPGWSSEDAFVVTGDIDAMWLRDSTNQLWPYLPYLNEAPELRSLVRGVVRRQLRSVQIDSYANAFNYNASGAGHPTDLRDPPMTPPVFEGKFEVDSLCAVIKLAHGYWNMTNDTTILDDQFRRAALTILRTLQNATLGTLDAFIANHNLPFYRFMRVDPWEYDAYPKATPVPTTGMARSAFRPSDDATKYDFLVPSNAMAAVELEHLAELALAVSSAHGGDPELEWIASMSAMIRAGIMKGLASRLVVITSPPNASKAPPNEATVLPILAYEIDGLGNQLAIDDPNIPSLLSLPLIGADFALETAPGTRAWLLSAGNPYYFCGIVGCGVGSPHTPAGWIWPMGLMVRALTSSNETEIALQLAMLKAAALETGWMHESFNPNNVSQFTRPWFAWANTLFGQTIIDVGRRFPHLIFTSH